MKRLIPLLALIVLLGAGCSDSVDYSGDNDDFIITGIVQEVGERSVSVTDVRVESAHGMARKWFDAGSHRLHDNYIKRGTWNDKRIQVGYVYSSAAAITSISEVHVGSRIRAIGNVRESVDGKEENRRPVYTSLQIIS